MTEAAIRLIKKCIETQYFKLDLGNCGLTDTDFEEGSPIDNALGRCTHLETLILSSAWTSSGIIQGGESVNKYNPNRLNFIPPAIWNLKNLQVLVCAGEQNARWGIQNISAISNLPRLHALDLSYNKIASLQLNRSSQLQELKLSGNEITEIWEQEILCYPFLKNLFLNDNGVITINGLAANRTLQHLGLSNNQIKKITGLKPLLNLQTLDLGENQITEIEGLETLLHLQKLHLDRNNITEIKGLENLTALQELTLHKNQIEEIKGLQRLTHLKELSLSNNQLTKIQGLDTLTELHTLWLSHNFIEELKGLKSLNSLQALYISNNEITAIKGLENLTNLDLLFLDHNHIIEVKGLETLTNLTDLYLNDNKIKTINNIGALSNLMVLELSNNQLREIKISENLEKLRLLYINKNFIEDISAILQLPSLQFVGLDDNPIVEKIPPEVMAAGWPAIRDRFLDDSQSVVFRDVKILLLGNTNVGKSNLLEYLETGEEPLGKDTTHGIRYTCLSNLIDHTNLHIWDFGGQEYFHATHQLFFSPGALHILLWSVNDIPRDKNHPEACFDLHYWLRCIEQLTPKDSQRSIEVIVAENKIDLNDYTAMLLNQKIYKSKINHFNFHFIHFSLTPLKRMNGFKELLSERIEKLYTSHSATYRNYLETIRRSEKDIMTIWDIGDEAEKISTAMKVFHNMGILLYFPDIIPEKIFVKPQALLDLLYKKILGREKKEQITEAQLVKAISGNKWSLTLPQIIGLLKHFDLVFQIPEQQEVYFIPQYLRESPLLVDFFEKHYFQQPNIFIGSDHYLMNLAMLKIYAAYGRYVKRNETNEQLFWKDGIIIEKNGRLLMVKYNRARQNIELYADIHHQNFELQRELVKFILSIPIGQHKMRPDMEDTEPLDEMSWESDYFSIQVSLDGRFFTDWTTLKEHVSKGIFQVEAVNREANDLEGTVTSPIKTLSVFDYNKYLPHANKGPMKKLFISYSKDDLPLVRKFLDHLSALQLEGKVAHWFCTELTAGTDWHHEIQAHFDQSDIVCFMVSPNFMRTQYIHEHEIKKAFERKAKDPHFKIIPIILDFCKWTTNHNNLGQFTALPYTAKPVVDFKNQNMAWYIIQECLRLMIEKDLHPAGEDFYTAQALPKDVLKLLERIVDGRVDA